MNLKYEFLIDTCADVSVFPASSMEKRKTASSLELIASNETPIQTFGFKKFCLRLGLKRELTWNFIVANVNRPIIGADFLRHFGLLVDVRNNCLIDNVSKSENKVSKCDAAMNRSISENSEFCKLFLQFPELTQNDKFVYIADFVIQGTFNFVGPIFTLA
ncbi:uncharacterized protein LOC142235717 [Haematobia irritans]|uniref:uncharacterized protein LOC142235717 n=1 Tax=Haematobia irritans TaxID=7368 RepID=UPI003F50897A